MGPEAREKWAKILGLLTGGSSLFLPQDLQEDYFPQQQALNTLLLYRGDGGLAANRPLSWRSTAQTQLWHSSPDCKWRLCAGTRGSFRCCLLFFSKAPWRSCQSTMWITCSAAEPSTKTRFAQKSLDHGFGRGMQGGSASRKECCRSFDALSRGLAVTSSSWHGLEAESLKCRRLQHRGPRVRGHPAKFQAAGLARVAGSAFHPRCSIQLLVSRHFV